MKLFRFGAPGAERPGIVDQDGKHRDLSSVVPDIDHELVSGHFAALRNLDVEDLPPCPADERIAAPVSGTRKFIGIGLNYRDHAAESGMPIPSEPVLFMKATSSICGPFDDVLLPPDATKADWEVELGVVIGREARYVALEYALAHVAGVCVVNDLSERHYQFECGGQWDKGKGCDTFGPVGPYLVTLDEIELLENLDLWCDVNGRRMQTGNTKSMIFDVSFLVHYLSRFMTLQPCDIITTGTPPGVALGMPEPRWLAEGDVVSLGITGLGVQRQRIARYRYVSPERSTGK